MTQTYDKRLLTEARGARVIQLPPSNGTDDTAAINAALTAANAAPGSVVRGLPGATYLLGSASDPSKAAIFLPPLTTVDMTGCTVKMIDGATGYPVQAWGQKFAVLSPPNMAAVGSTTGGTLAAGTYTYYVTAVTASGETMPCPAVSVTTTGSTGSVALSWSAPTVPSGGPAITGYNVYGRGTYTSSTMFLGNVTGTTFTDTGAAVSAATLPTGNATISRTAGIRVIGGTWDANGSNRPCDFIWPTSTKNAGHCFDLQKVDDLLLDDVTVLNARKWAVAVADFGRIRTRNVRLNTLSDGIHVLGPGTRWVCEGTNGVTGDDFHGISLAEWPNYAVSMGTIRSITIREIDGDNVPSFLRVLGSPPYKIGSLNVSNVRGTYNGTFLGGIYVADNQPSPGNPNGTDIDLLEINGVNVASTGGTSPQILLTGRNFKKVSISNVYIDDAYAAGIQLTRGGGSGGTGVVESLAITNVIRKAEATNQFAVLFDAYFTCKRATLQNVSTIGGGFSGYVARVNANVNLGELVVSGGRLQNNNAGGSAVSIEQSTSTVSRLVIRDLFVEAGFRALDFFAGTVPTIVFDGVRLASAGTPGELLRLTATTATDITLRNIVAESLSNTGLIEAKTGAQVTVRGHGITLPAGKVAVYANGTPTSVRSLSLDVPLDLALTGLVKTNGDLANNTNASLSCGAGPAVSNGTSWKNLYSGTTY